MRKEKGKCSYVCEMSSQMKTMFWERNTKSTKPMRKNQSQVTLKPIPTQIGTATAFSCCLAVYCSTRQQPNKPLTSPKK
jgi:hypothetical protein